MTAWQLTRASVRRKRTEVGTSECPNLYTSFKPNSLNKINRVEWDSTRRNKVAPELRTCGNGPDKEIILRAAIVNLQHTGKMPNIYQIFDEDEKK